jgi:hypothetical protein
MEGTLMPYVCSDCYAVCEGVEKHPESPACDDFDLHEEEIYVDDDSYKEPDGSELFYEQSKEMQDLYSAVAVLSVSLGQLERRFNMILSSIVKAANDES